MEWYSPFEAAMLIRNNAFVTTGIYLSLLLFVFMFAGVEILHHPLLHGCCAHQSVPFHASDSGGSLSLVDNPEGNSVSSICPICTLLSHLQLIVRSAQGIATLFGCPQLNTLFFDGGFLQKMIAESFIPRGPPHFSITIF